MITFSLDSSTWTAWNYFAWWAAILVAYDLFTPLGKLLAPHYKKIPITGKHLDRLELYDLSIIVFNRLTTPWFLLHMLQFCYNSDRILWTWDIVQVIFSVGVVIPLMFLVYDFFYVPYHGLLHVKQIYPYIHKHHHLQNAPRTNDALNTHPIEFTMGQWNHLWTLYLVSRVVNVHVFAVLAFIAIGGFMASMNHTRLDIKDRAGFWAVVNHDTHHWFPTSNYGQYIVFWDRVFGTYKEGHPGVFLMFLAAEIATTIN